LPGEKSFEIGSVSGFEEAKKYRGRPHDLKLFDEVSELDETVYTFLIGWARTSEEGVPVRVVAAGNPPTNAEGAWVIRRWRPWLDPVHHNPAKPGELRWFATLDGEDKEIEGSNGEEFEHITKDGKTELIRPKSRTFIPARLTDNKYLASTNYASVLQNMPEPYRSQLLYGDFGLALRPDPWQVVPLDWIYQANLRWKQFEEEGVVQISANSNPIYALDVAEAGNDKTAFCKLTNNIVQFINYIKEPDTMKQVDMIAPQLAKTRAAPIAVDAIGAGIGVAHRLKQKGFNVVPIKVSKASTSKDNTGHFEFF
jgi:hypothetical protein